MSSPATSVNQIMSDLVNTILTVLDSFFQALQQYAPVIVGVLITLGMIRVASYFADRIPFVRRILGWIGL
jgi:hypothetical protein